MGKVILTVESGQGVTRIQLQAANPAQERESLALYRTLKPIVETINVHVPPAKSKP